MSSKKVAFYNFHKNQLRDKLIEHIKDNIDEDLKISNLIFYINFSIKFEKYFSEPLVESVIKNLINDGFRYHFMSDKETNRLDKPEWIFDFLFKKYIDLYKIFDIYSKCNLNHDGCKKFSSIIEETQGLIYQKIKEIYKSNSTQKRSLILHFISKYKKFESQVEQQFNCQLNSKDISYIINAAQNEFVISELSRIHEMKIILWFQEYKKLCNECILYLQNMSRFDISFSLTDFIEAILRHIKNVLENFRFIDREEIKIVGFIFSELESLKEFIADKENEICLLSANNILDDMASQSLEKISIVNGEILKLIKRLAENDVNMNFKKIQYFNFTTLETQRNFLVNMNRMLDEYKHVIFFDLFESTIFEKLDGLMVDEILLKTQFSKDEFEEFKDFFNKLLDFLVESNSSSRSNIKKYKWKTEYTCKCIEAIFNGVIIQSSLYKKLQNLYSS